MLGADLLESNRQHMCMDVAIYVNTMARHEVVVHIYVCDNNCNIAAPSTLQLEEVVN